jgi:hypothetical protein
VICAKTYNCLLMLALASSSCDQGARTAREERRIETPTPVTDATAPGPDAQGEPPSDDVCSPPDGPRLTLSIDRHVIPIGGEYSHEAGEVTVDGSCTPKRECIRIRADELTKLAAMVRAASPLVHREPVVSPHYGNRTITAKWDGGSCTLTDSGETPAIDTTAFYNAFQAISVAIVNGREHAGSAAKPK